MELDKEIAESFLDTIKFGSKDDKFKALIELRDVRGINLDKVSPTLYSIIENSQDKIEKFLAAISLVKLGITSPDLIDKLFNGLDFFVNNPDYISSDLIIENHLLKTMSTLKGNMLVINNITESIKNCRNSDNSQLLINPCLRALGALGDESSREFLEFWEKKGNMAAISALSSFGEKWDVILEGEVIQDEETIGTFTAFMQEGMPKKDKLKYHGMPCNVYLTNYRIVAAYEKHNAALFSPKLVIMSELKKKKREKLRAIIPTNVLKENPKNFSMNYDEIDKVKIVKRNIDTWKLCIYIGDLETPKYSFGFAPMSRDAKSYVESFETFIHSFFSDNVFPRRVFTKL